MQKPKIHVVGCGQVGTIMCNYFLARQFPLTIYDTNNNFAQIPWGWMRRVTLQQKERLRFPLQPLSLPEMYIRRGPMIISTQEKQRVDKWKQWLSLNHKWTNARMLKPNEALDWDIPQKYNLLCDQNDYLFDFNQYKNDSIAILKVQTQWISESPMQRLCWNDDWVEGILLQNGRFVRVAKNEKILLCIGNQTNRFFSFPIGGVTLQYTTVAKKQIPEKPYIAHWTDSTSIQYFHDYVKIGCGMNGKISTLPPVSFWLKFFPLLGKQNYSWKNSITQVRQHWDLNDAFQSCEVDITPDFLPIIEPIGKNLTIVCGLSGSGFTVYEPWFQEHVRYVLFHDTTVNPFTARRKFSASSFLYYIS